MSWSIRSGRTNLHNIQGLKNSIEDAAKKGVLMFASLSDEQPIPDSDVYPACMGRSVFRIGAAAPEGNPYPRINVKDANYIFPGVDIPNENSDHGAFLTGSSIATALAAGFGALLIYCARLTGMKAVTGNDIERMFDKLDPQGKKFPLVWDGDVFEEFNPSPPLGLQAITKVVHELYESR